MNATDDSAILRPGPSVEPLRLESLFAAVQPLEVDVGCGKGRFLAARAASNPGTNYLGVDRQISRLRKAMRKALRFAPANVRLLYAEAFHAVRHLLPSGSVSVFYASFPDPWPKRRHHRRRLFTPAFLDALHDALSDGGAVHVTTDHAEYAQVVRAFFAADGRFEPVGPFLPASEEERTEFDLVFARQGAEVVRCSYRKRPSAPGGAPTQKVQASPSPAASRRATGTSAAAGAASRLSDLATASAESHAIHQPSPTCEK
jgi:tRNA (guanine-N7-)-methyltransferase